jgi:hypothetical protein
MVISKVDFAMTVRPQDLANPPGVNAMKLFTAVIYEFSN